MLAVCLETDIQNQLSVSNSGRLLMGEKTPAAVHQKKDSPPTEPRETVKKVLKHDDVVKELEKKYGKK